MIKFIKRPRPLGCSDIFLSSEATGQKLIISIYRFIFLSSVTIFVVQNYHDQVVWKEGKGFVKTFLRRERRLKKQPLKFRLPTLKCLCISLSETGCYLPSGRGWWILVWSRQNLSDSPSPPPINILMIPIWLAVNFNPPPNLYTLLATTDPFSVPLEHHVIPKFPQSPPPRWFWMTRHYAAKL